MSISYKARKAAWSKVDDTCPHVDNAFDELRSSIVHEFDPDRYQERWLKEEIEVCITKVKERTEALRAALVEAYEEYFEEVDGLKEEIYRLEDELRNRE